MMTTSGYMKSGRFMKFWMEILAILLFAFAISSGRRLPGRRLVPRSVHHFSNRMIKYINYLNTTWRAGKNFGNARLKYKAFTGVHKDNHMFPLPTIREIVPGYSRVVPELPDSFDARDQWPNCPTIGQIRDQGNCGSCWALAAVEAISDRHCIHSKGRVNVQISAEDLLACCDNCGTRCEGGFPGHAWKYWVDNGIVTGGLYDSSIGCQPYSLPPLFTSTIPGKLRQSKPFIGSPVCVKSCAKGYNMSYEDDKYYGELSYSIGSDVQQIQTEIYNNGPVVAGFNVYEDFKHYKSGVYQQHSDVLIGGHAVKILGWGVEQGTPYWSAANSWSPHWGDKGFFKILRGFDECGIESQVVAGIPKL